jgi:hypothetical protein
MTMHRQTFERCLHDGVKSAIVFATNIKGKNEHETRVKMPRRSRRVLMRKHRSQHIAMMVAVWDSAVGDRCFADKSEHSEGEVRDS